MKNGSQITELRKAMFDQLERLNDPTRDLDKELKRASAITSVGTVIINSVKVENDFIRLSGGDKKKNQKQISNGE